MINPSDLQNRAVTGPVESDVVSPSRLAADWGVHVKTVYRDIRKGALRAFRLPSGRVRIRRDDARSYGRPIE
jgi:predicted site-specific integrase-resolvase